MTKQEESLRLKIDLVLKSLSLGKVTYTINSPDNLLFGDLSTNIALVTYPKVKKRYTSTLDLAREIVARLEKEKDIKQTFVEITVEEPGFINLWFSKDYLLAQLEELLKRKENFTRGKLKNQKIMVEFADPNPFKEFHIGHLRNISLGESFSRLFEAMGAEVWRANYQGDVGMHVAKALYGLLQISNLKSQISKLEKKSTGERIKLLGQCYTDGAKAYEEDKKAKEEIEVLNIKAYKNDPSIREIWEIGRRWSLDYFEELYRRVGTKYKSYYFESQTAPLGREIVLSHIKDGIFERDDGAVIFRGEKYRLHTRVFVTKEDYATYEAKDLALAKLKYQDLEYDKSIIITAHEQAPYFKVILAALRLIEPELASKTIHYSFGFVGLKNNKMSSRIGNVVTAEWLLDEAKSRILQGFPEMKEKVAEKVSVGAVKYSMLKFSPASNINFSFKDSISLEGNSGPYLQYAYARTQSILAKAKISNVKFLASRRSGQMSNFKLEPEELFLLRIIYHFPEVVEEATGNFAPNLLCNFLFDLAQKFNLFYQKHTVLGSEKEEFRLLLTQGVGKILKNGLYLLGIATPERM